jgi:DNA-binding NarL/FixJ family response regulator
MRQAMPERQRYRVVVADDHAVARRGLVASLAEIPETEICGEATGGLEALKIVMHKRPDLIILGLNLQTVQGLRIVRMLRMAVPETEVLVVTLLDSPDVAAIVFRAGARALITKSDRPEELHHAVSNVRKRQHYITRKLRAKLSEPLGSFDGCPDPELSSDEIARVMNFAEMKIRAELFAIIPRRRR